MDILGLAKKKNPILVGDSEPGQVIREILKKIQIGEIAQPKQLPQWLLKAKPVNHLSAKTEEVHNDMCVRLHPSFHSKNERIVRIPVPMLLTTSSYGPNMLLRQPFQPKLQPNRELRERVHLKPMSPLVARQILFLAEQRFVDLDICIL